MRSQTAEAPRAEFGADSHYSIHHGFWDVAAVFPSGLCTGLHAPAADVLANSYADAAQLRWTYEDHQIVVAAEALDLDWRSR